MNGPMPENLTTEQLEEKCREYLATLALNGIDCQWMGQAFEELVARRKAAAW